MTITTRRLAAEEKRLGEKLVGIPRERTRERKALAAEKLERAIEKQLIERLRSGAYGDKLLIVERILGARFSGGWRKAGRRRQMLMRMS